MQSIYIFLLAITTLLSSEFDNFKSKSQEENKLTMLVFSGSDWCIPCIHYKKNFLDQVSFVEYRKSNINVYIADFPRNKKNKPTKEKLIENEALMAKYNSEGKFPFTVVFDTKGYVVKQWEGCPFYSIEDMTSTFNSIR